MINPNKEDILRHLQRSKNVLLSGPPGTGKSILLSDAAKAFLETTSTQSSTALPQHQPTGGVPIPAPSAGNVGGNLFPGGAKSDRKVFRTVFHQNTRYRDMLNGLTPNISPNQDGDFTISKGILYRASEHAKTSNGASLLIIDEINRGPAVQAFGGSIVAIEADKRLAPDGTETDRTQMFEIVDPTTGEMIEYALPDDLFILAAMNQADASVEPMDVAFIRRWHSLRLGPDEQVLRGYFGLESQKRQLPQSPNSAEDVYEALVQAWSKLNSRISIGKSADYQIGHGVLMAETPTADATVETAIDISRNGWSRIMAHLDEVFFGDLRGLAVTLNCQDASSGHPIKISEVRFGSDMRMQIKLPIYDAVSLYKSLKVTSADSVVP